MFLDSYVLEPNISNAHCSNYKYKTSKMKNKTVKLVVVSFANTCAKPFTMVVELNYTVVTNVTMTCPRGSKNITSFTKFKLEANWYVCVHHLWIIDTIFFAHVCVLAGQITSSYRP
jgi:hypothetical protein